MLAPQLPRAGDHWHRYADDVRDAVSELCAQYSLDKARLFDLGLAQPDFWAALWGGEAARAQQREFVRALELGQPDSRIWADDGKDHVGSARAAYADERIYRWLLRQVR